jgi:hypothetical protein
MSIVTNRIINRELLDDKIRQKTFKFTADPNTVVDETENTFYNIESSLYKRWVSLGGVTVPYEEPPESNVKVITRMQALIALENAGLLSSIENFIDTQADNTTKIVWRNAREFRSDSPMIISLGAVLSLSTEQIDHLFEVASGINI